jgi:hypothetical protein
MVEIEKVIRKDSAEIAHFETASRVGTQDDATLAEISAANSGGYSHCSQAWFLS